MQGLSRQHSGQRVVGGMAPYTIGGEGLAGAHNGGYGTAGVGGAPAWDPFQMVGGITPQQHQYQLQQHQHQSQQRGLLTPVSPPDGRCGSSADAIARASGGLLHGRERHLQGQQRRARARTLGCRAHTLMDS